MTKATRIVLWAWVIAAGILIGGGIYEHIVFFPLWTGSPPESVTAWTHGVPQAKFFGIVTPVYGLCSLALFILSFWMPPRVGRFSLVAGVSGIVVVIWTFLFFIPILGQTQATGGTGLSGDEITRLVDQFVWWNYVRYVLLIGGWLAGLMAFSMSGTSEQGRE